jgi:virulence factor Mce-like protein
MAAPSFSAHVGRLVALTIVGVLVIAAVVTFLGSDSGTKRLTASFPRTVSIYEGSAVKVLGVQVGQVDTVEPAGTTVKVTMSYQDDVKVPADAKAVIIAPSVVGDRFIQLTPVYDNGPVLQDGATLQTSDTGVPLELDQIYQSLDDLAVGLGPQGANKEGALTRLLQSTARNFGGQGEQFNETIHNLSQFTSTLDNNKEALFSTAREVERFVRALANNDQTVRDFNDSLSAASGVLEDERQDLSAALKNLGVAMEQVSSFVKENRTALSSNIKGLVRVTDILVKQRAALDETLTDAPVALTNLFHTYNPRTGTLDTSSNLPNENLTALQNDPASTLCSLITTADPNGDLCDQLTQALPPGGGAGARQSASGGQLTGLLQRAGAGGQAAPPSRRVVEIEHIDTTLAGIVGGAR